MGNDRYRQRKDCLQKINKELLYRHDEFLPRTQLWNKMVEYAFVLSPKGVGMDCHRTWEALALGCIPIICIPEFKNIVEGLPVLVVNDWSEINPLLLKNTIEKFYKKKYELNFDKLRLTYWTDKINSFQN